MVAAAVHLVVMTVLGAFGGEKAECLRFKFFSGKLYFFSVFRLLNLICKY